MTGEITWLTTADVAKLFKVRPPAVARWRNAGKLKGIKTPGGHWRYDLMDVRALLEGVPREYLR